MQTPHMLAGGRRINFAEMSDVLERKIWLLPQKTDDLDATMVSQSCRHPRSAPAAVHHNPHRLLQFDLLPIIELRTKPGIRTNLRVGTRVC
jgi:hypothetical protein